MSEWKETEIGKIPKEWDFLSVGELVKQNIIDKPLDGNHGGIHPKGTDFVGKGIPFIMATDIKNGKVDLINCKFITKKQADSLNKGFAITDDVLLTHKASLGRTAIVGEIETPYIMLTPQVTYYRVKDKNKLNNKYLKYFFDSPAFQDTLLNHGDGGSTRAYVGITAQRDLPVCLPPTPEQRAIASVLSSLDDKIDLLHRQNKTLEAMAETLFRQWFVEEADEVWEEGFLHDVISVKGGTTPSTKKPEYWDGDIYWTSPRDLSNHTSVFLFDTGRKITEKGLAKIGSSLLPIGTVLLSSRAPIGYLAITEIPLSINQGYIAIVCDKVVSNYFIYLWCKANMEGIKNSGNGSVFQEIAKSVFKEISITIPPPPILDDFGKTINPVFSKIKTNQQQIRTLEKLRDTLLPKLMSGEVKVEL